METSIKRTAHRDKGFEEPAFYLNSISRSFPMIPFGSLGMFTLLSLCVGAVLSSDPSPACRHPPCRDSLVAAPPIQPGTGAGAGLGLGACDGQAGPAGCTMVVSPPAVSDAHLRVEHRQELPQVQPKVSDVIPWLRMRSHPVLFTILCV